MTITFSDTSLTLESALELLLGATTELVVSDCWIKIYFLVTCHNPIKKWFLFVAYNKGRHFKVTSFWFAVSLWGTHLSSFITFPICFTFRTTIKLLMLSSSTPSHIVVRGSASMIISVGCCQLPMTGPYAPRLKGSFVKLCESPLHCMYLNSSWAKCVVDVASCLCCSMTHFEL